jgi:hypothetical protein
MEQGVMTWLLCCLVAAGGLLIGWGSGRASRAAPWIAGYAAGYLAGRRDRRHGG